MNNTVKLIIGIILGVTVICLFVGAAGLLLFRTAGSAINRTLQTGPGEMAEVSQTIAVYDLPEDFNNAYAAQIGGFDLVIYTGEDGHSHIFLFQLPSGINLDPAEVEQQFRQAIQDQNTGLDRMDVVDRSSVTIRGQETVLIVSEGVNHEDQAFRQVSAVFAGNSGQAMVVFERPVSSWDQAEAEAFLSSIR